MKTLLVILTLFILNHISVTLIRVYLRQEKLKNYYIVNPEMLGFVKGIERRALRPATFICTSFLTVMEFALIILL